MPSLAEPQLRLARAELESGLRAGQDRRAETLIDTYPAVDADPEAVLELVYTEFVVRQQLGQNPAPSEWLARFPQWRGDLEQMFQVHDALCQAESSRPGGLVGLTLTAGGRPAVVSTPRIPGYEVETEVGR